MSKPDPPRGLRVTMKLVDEVQLERLGAMDDEDLDRSMRAEGVAPGAAEAIERRLGWRGSAATNAVAIAPRRQPGWAMWAAAAALVAAAILAVIGPSRLVGGPPPVAPHPAGPVSGDALAHAEALRDEAERACQQGLWDPCKDRLDEAKAADPAGEEAERVQRMRAILRSVQVPRETKPPRP